MSIPQPRNQQYLGGERGLMGTTEMTDIKLLEFGHLVNFIGGLPIPVCGRCRRSDPSWPGAGYFPLPWGEGESRGSVTG